MIKIPIPEALGDGEKSAEAFPLNSWTLSKSVLYPTTRAIQKQCQMFADVGEEDFLVTFEFPGIGGSPKKQIYIHRSLLVSSGGALKTLVTSGFKESNSKSVTVYDSYDVWQLIRRYLYRVPVDMKQVTTETVMVAHRYELCELFCACFLWIEISGKWQGKALVEDWLEVVSLVQPPRAFCEYFALQFSINFDSVVEQLAECNWKVGTQNVWVSLFSRGMFAAIVKYITRTAAKDYSVILLDALFTDLVHEASDEDIKHILSFFDWQSAAVMNALQSETGLKWGQRCWRMLALNRCETAEKGSFDLRVRCRAPFRVLCGDICAFKGRYVSSKDELGTVNAFVRVQYLHGIGEEDDIEDFESIMVALRLKTTLGNAKEYTVAGKVFVIREPCSCRIPKYNDFTFMESEADFGDDADRYKDAMLVGFMLEEAELTLENRRSCDKCMWMVAVRMCFTRKRGSSRKASPWKGCEDRDDLQLAKVPQLNAARTVVSRRRDHRHHGDDPLYNHPEL